MAPNRSTGSSPKSPTRRQPSRKAAVMFSSRNRRSPGPTRAQGHSRRLVNKTKKDKATTQAASNSHPGIGHRGAALTTFHPFLRLPVELQQYIWDLWRANPVRRPRCVCYCLPLSQRFGREYVAFDVLTRKDVTESLTLSTAQVGPIDQLSWFWAHPHRTPIRIASSPGQVGGSTSKDFTQVDFDRDFFLLRSSYRLPGQLRWLLKGIGASDPPPMPADHCTANSTAGHLVSSGCRVAAAGPTVESATYYR